MQKKRKAKANTTGTLLKKKQGINAAHGRRLPIMLYKV
jgi:hypothetical protein